MDKPILVDGTDTRRAPAPKHGLQRAVFKTVEALERATEKAVYEMIPAAITQGNQVVSHKKLLRSLKNGVYRGYFITEKNIFRIAPLSYYQARQEYIKNLPGIPQASHDGHQPLYEFEQVDGITIHISSAILRVLKLIGFVLLFAGAVAIGRFTP